MARIYLMGENQLTLESLKNFLNKKGYEVLHDKIVECIRKEKIFEIKPDIIFWDSDIIESRENVVFDFIESDLPNIGGIDTFHASDGDPLSDGVDPSGSDKLGVTSISSEDYMHMSHHQLQSYDPDEIMEEINSFLRKN